MKKFYMTLVSMVMAAAARAEDAVQGLAGDTLNAAKEPAAQAEKILAGLTMGALVWGLIFNSVGVFAFYYGKKIKNKPYMAIGILLMGYSWVVQDTTMIIVVGAVLTGSMYFFRRNV